MTLRPKGSILDKIRHILTTPIYFGNAPTLAEHIVSLKKEKNVHAVNIFTVRPIPQMEVLLEKPFTSKGQFEQYLAMRHFPVNQEDVQFIRNVGIINTSYLHAQFYKKE